MEIYKFSTTAMVGIFKPPVNDEDLDTAIFSSLRWDLAIQQVTV